MQTFPILLLEKRKGTQRTMELRKDRENLRCVDIAISSNMFDRHGLGTLYIRLHESERVFDGVLEAHYL